MSILANQVAGFLLLALLKPVPDLGLMSAKLRRALVRGDPRAISFIRFREPPPVMGVSRPGFRDIAVDPLGTGFCSSFT